MRRPGLTRGMIFAALALALLVGALSGGPAGAQPDFTDVTDILHGRRHLLRTDDLVLTYGYGSGSSSEALGNLLLTGDSQVTDILPSSLGVVGSVSTSTVTAARPFDTPYDLAVSAVLNGATLVSVLDARPNDGSPFNVPGSVDLSALIGGGPLPVYSAAADFTGDGFDEILFVVGDTTSGGVALVATAVDTTDPRKGLTFVVPPAGTPAAQLSAVFNDHPPFAIDTSTGTARVFFPTGGTGSTNCGGYDSGLSINSYTVDPTSLTLTNAQPFQVTIPEGDACVHMASIAVGRFATATHGQLAVAYAVQGGTVRVIFIDVDAQGTLAQTTRYDTGQAVGGGRAWLRSGQFDWSGAFDQAALVISSGQENSLQILAFDQNLTLQPGPVSTAIGQSPLCVGDVAVGNFDQTQKNPTPPPDTIRNPNLQLAAFLQLECGTPNFVVQTWDVTPVDTSPGQFQVGPGSTVFSFTFTQTDTIQPQVMSMAAVDLQGRSARLGAPTKVTIANRQQPVVVTGAPPMHVDFVTPIGATTPQVLNVSVVPDGFYAQYNTEDKTSNQSSSQHTTSWSVGVKEETSLDIGFGDVEAGEGLDNTTKFGAEQAWSGSVQNTTDYGNAEAFNGSVQTKFADYVRYDEARINIYIYPVLGKTACPADQVTGTPPNTSCKVAEVPLTVQFSAPDQASHQNVAGTSLEWYQPPWQPGHILSYPGNQGQLQALQPDLVQLSQNETFETDGLTSTQSLTWSGESGTDTTTSTSSNYSFDASNSFTGAGDIAGFYAKINLTVDVSGSFGFEGLTTSQTSLGESAGVVFTKPGTFLDPTNYQYKYTPVIYGQQQPGGLVNDQSLDTHVTTFGVLRTVYVVDPLSTGAGFWQDAYGQHPDVALNHPVRWQVKTATSDAGDGTCLAFNPNTSDSDCVHLGTKLPPTGIWDDEFHAMRGLFITPAAHPGQGSQLQVAHAGDQLMLQARVYNYSLKAMNPGTTVHVRFYGQEWDHTTNSVPVDPIGNSFLIGEVTLGPIPPFNTDTDNPNWLLASLPPGSPFDTTPYANKTLTFWVVVWMEDANGALVQKLDNHGLTGLPGPLTGILDAAALEESYSNNVGFYKYALPILPPSTAAAPAAPDAAAEATSAKPRPAVKMDKVRVSGHTISPGVPLQVGTTLRTGAAAVPGGATVYFYDGDPEAGGTLVDVERLGHLRAHDTYDVRVPFRSNVCGTHRLFVTVGPMTPFEQTQASRAIKVHCP